MVTPIPATIVIMPFPFTDLTRTKLRPAVVLTSARRGDWVLCQITSKSYSDPDAIELTTANLLQGTLVTTSYARPLKLFTANESLMQKAVAILRDDAFETVLTAVIEGLESNLPS